MTIDIIFKEIESVMQTITPDVMPAITFRPGPYNDTLKKTDYSRTDAYDATRIFQVGEHEGLGTGQMNDTLAHLVHFARIEIQYIWNIANGGWKELRDMMATDKDRLIQVLRPHAWSLATTAKQIDFVSDVRTSKSKTEHYLDIVIAVDYRLGAQS